MFSIDNDGDLRVRYEEKAFFINPEAVVKVRQPTLKLHTHVLDSFSVVCV